jgi:hypothetical protein
VGNMFQLIGPAVIHNPCALLFSNATEPLHFVGSVNRHHLELLTPISVTRIILHFFVPATSARASATILRSIIQSNKGVLSPALASLFALSFSSRRADGRVGVLRVYLDRLYGMNLQMSSPLTRSA